jgi:site-specific DNA-methyltransferase (adenine-specific)
MEVTDKITITKEDNMEMMARYPDNYFELAIVDPPYRDSNQPTKDMRSSGSMKSLEGRPSKKYFDELLRVSKNQIIWGANNFQLPQFMGFVVWKKKTIGENFTMSMCEIASISEDLGTVSKWIEVAPQGTAKDPRIHPTQKPIKLYEWLLMNYAKEGDKILDTHLGSGSIAIACHNLGFELTACELDEDYYKAAINRIQNRVNSLDLFDLIRENQQDTEE